MKFLFLALALVGASAQAAPLSIDPNHSTIGFEAKHLKVSSIPGRFRDFTGTVDLNEKDFTQSKIAFIVKIASIDTGVAKRDDHLRTDEFFGAEKFPEAKFVSTSIRKREKDKYTVEGDLTIRDQTHKARFDVEQIGQVEDPMMKAKKLVFRGDGVINRKEFGVNYGPDAIVSDKIKLFLNLEVVKN